MGTKDLYFGDQTGDKSKLIDQRIRNLFEGFGMIGKK